MAIEREPLQLSRPAELGDVWVFTYLECDQHKSDSKRL